MPEADSVLTVGEEGHAAACSQPAANLLKTKLFVPPARADQILRPRLLDLMNQGLERSLLLISAPAGYGKTTLVSRWLRESKVASAWLSLDEGDNDPIRFLGYLAAALQPFTPSIQGELWGMLQTNPPAATTAVLNLLSNEIAAHPGPIVLVLDDFHVLHAAPVPDLVASLLDHMPPPLHVILLTRIDPPLPLARLRVRDQLTEVRADQLRFTLDEAAQFLKEGMGLAVSHEDAAALQARTEGWIVGIQLAALSMQDCSDVHGFVSAFTGSHYYVMDYLVEEVLKLQPAEVGDFLLRTSTLDRLCAPLCEAVMQVDASTSTDGQGMLEGLERMNLFLIPLDERRNWYRYHHLFADVLRRRLERQSPDLIPRLHAQALQWYEQNGFIPEAIRHALLAKRHDRAAELIERHGCSLLISGETATFLEWIKAIDFRPEQHPWLGIQQAWALAMAGEVIRAEEVLQIPERVVSALEPTVEVRTMLGTILAARAYCANTQGDSLKAARDAGQALELLPDCSSISRSIRSVATTVLGDASWIHGDLSNAARAYTEAIRIGKEAGDAHMVIIASTDLAEIRMEQGQLHQAEDIYKRAQELAVRPDGRKSPLTIRIESGLGRLAYEYNCLEDASLYLLECIDLCKAWENTDDRAGAYALLARVRQAQGDPNGAVEAIRAAARFAGEHAPAPRQLSLVRSDLARAWMARGDLEAASRLLQESGISIEDQDFQRREAEYGVLARLLLARGDCEAAASLAEHLFRQAERTGAGGRAIESLNLCVLALQGKGDTDGALAALEKALLLAGPEGYVRTFLDEGQPLMPVLARLCRLQARRAGTGYASRLVSAFGDSSGEAGPSMERLIAPLSRRELEVLRLIAAGNSNQEIGEKLVISTATVKRHISNIYGKLEAQSRTQAIALAKELRLLD